MAVSVRLDNSTIETARTEGLVHHNVFEEVGERPQDWMGAGIRQIRDYIQRHYSAELQKHFAYLRENGMAAYEQWAAKRCVPDNEKPLRKLYGW